MRWLEALLGAQLAFATHHARQAPSDQVPLVNTTYNNYAMNPMFRYVPKMEWPRDPADGWIFSITIGASSPYDGPEKGLAFPYTTLAGASVGQRFVGNGITVYGWAGADTRFRLSLSSDLASDITVAQRFEGELATVMAPDNRWIDFNLTLVEGALQMFNISIHQQLHLDYPSQDAAPQPYMKAIEDDGVTINPFFTVEGDVVAKIGGELRLPAGELTCRHRGRRSAHRRVAWRAGLVPHLAQYDYGPAPGPGGEGRRRHRV